MFSSTWKWEPGNLLLTSSADDNFCSKAFSWNVSDDIIALNKRRNEEAENEEAETLSVLTAPAPPVTISKVANVKTLNKIAHMQQVNNRLR